MESWKSMLNEKLKENGDSWEYNIFGTGSYGIGAGTYLFFDNRGILQYWSD
jgi:hypothetical protein